MQLTLLPLFFTNSVLFQQVWMPEKNPTCSVTIVQYLDQNIVMKISTITIPLVRTMHTTQGCLKAWKMHSKSQLAKLLFGGPLGVCAYYITCKCQTGHRRYSFASLSSTRGRGLGPHEETCSWGRPTGPIAHSLISIDTVLNNKAFKEESL